jgi:antitoxin component of MazEF toxin-antitoxin module
MTLWQLEPCMQITMRDIGNSKGVVLPKPVLAKAGLADQAGHRA